MDFNYYEASTFPYSNQRSHDNAQMHIEIVRFISITLNAKMIYAASECDVWGEFQWVKLSNNFIFITHLIDAITVILS